MLVSVVGGDGSEEEGHDGAGGSGGGEDRLGGAGAVRRAMVSVVKAMFRAPRGLGTAMDAETGEMT